MTHNFGIIKKYELQFFFLVTFFLSWLFWFLSGVLSKDWIFKYDYQWFISQIGVYCPAYTAFLISYINYPKLRKHIITSFILIFIPVILLGFAISFIEVTGILSFNIVFIILIIVNLLWIIFYFGKGHHLFSKSSDIKININLKWSLIAILIFPLIFICVWYFSNHQNIQMSVSSLEGIWYDVIKAILLIFSVNFIFGGSLGEEIGWRGFVLPRLLDKYSPFAASLILCVFWALWHFPIDITQGFMLQGIGAIFVRMLWTFPLTLIFTWFFMHTKGSVFIAVLLHTSINILPDLGFTNYENSIPILFVFMFMLSIIFVIKDRMWKRTLAISLNRNIFNSFRE